jgi:hypothetical protein
MRLVRALVLVFALPFAGRTAESSGFVCLGYTEGSVPKQHEASVGVPVTVRAVVWEGSALEVAPIELETPVVVRITDVWQHGGSLRYDLVAYGLDPGEYDLTDFVQRVDGTPVGELSPVPFSVLSILPPGQVEPNTLAAGEVPAVGGYERTLWIAGCVWLLGLAVILFAARRRHARAEQGARPASLAERLRPLVEDALAGKLTQADRAALELTLIAVWRKRLALEELGVAEALATLRTHAEAGPLLTCLEDWLHRPVGAAVADVDLNDLLAPYRDLPADGYGEHKEHETDRVGAAG